jgi:hypothetical protein
VAASSNAVVTVPAYEESRTDQCDSLRCGREVRTDSVDEPVKILTHELVTHQNHDSDGGHDEGVFRHRLSTHRLTESNENPGGKVHVFSSLIGRCVSRSP